MVSAAQFEDSGLFLYESCDIEWSKEALPVPGKGFKINLYLLETIQDGSNALASSRQDEQNLLDSLLLSQWEDRSWKGFLSYDVTACETKIVDGEKQFIAQLNDKLRSSSIKEFESKFLKPFGCLKPNFMESCLEQILFCISEGEAGGPRLVHSALLPNDGILVIANVNPVEYGHVFLVPYVNNERPFCFDAMTLGLVTRITKEINSSLFYVFFDYEPSTTLDQMYFQASYFANPLPVELFPTVNVCSQHATAISICEIEGYPLKSLVFESKNLIALVNFVAEMSSTLHDRNMAFSLLITNCGEKVYLFPQVQSLLTGYHLSAWECGGFFVYPTEFSYDNVSETEISTQMASVALDECSFQDLKHLCCSIASKNA